MFTIKDFFEYLGLISMVLIGYLAIAIGVGLIIGLPIGMVILIVRWVSGI